MAKVHDCINFVQTLLFPPTCLLCEAPGYGSLDLCRDCLRTLPWLTHACPRCARPLPVRGASCGACLKHPPPFEACRALWHFHPPVSGLIAALKFRGYRASMRLLGELMARRTADWERPDCLVPVPLHPTRYRQRGFNQSLEIARFVAAYHRIPLRPELCRRTRATPPQRHLNARERHRNLHGAFAATKAAQGLSVAVIDDVMTTGATVRGVAEALKRAGAGRVTVWVLARA